MAIDADPEPENQNIARWMANGYTLVFRPQWSGGGEGVFFLSRDDEAWRINGHSATRAAGPQQGGGAESVWPEALAGSGFPLAGLEVGAPAAPGPSAPARRQPVAIATKAGADQSGKWLHCHALSPKE